MLVKIHRLTVAMALIALVLAVGVGCGKYDALERNMQYVSSDLLRRDALDAWQAATAAHEQWRKAGASHDANDPAFVAYQDAYLKYAIVYNELLDRQGASTTARLRGATDEVPPAPPGTAPAQSAKPAPQPVSPAEPKARELNDAAPVEKAAPRAAGSKASAPVRPVQVAASTNGERYVVASGDSLRLIAKRHGVTEKSLMDANGIANPDKLAIGQSLAIPR